MDDDGLLQRLRPATAARSQRAREQTEAAFERRRPETGLAALAADSALAPAGSVRATADVRMLTFESAELLVELEVRERGEARELTGKLLPPRAAELAIVRPDGAATAVSADASGDFAATLERGGPISLQLPDLELEWFVI